MNPHTTKVFKEQPPYWTDLWQLGIEETLLEGYRHRLPDAEEYIRRLLTEEDSGATNIPEVGWAAIEAYIIASLVKEAKEWEEDNATQTG